MTFPRVLTYLSFLCFLVMPAASAMGVCSVQNLTRCIDSACNMETEHGAATRCIMCGTSAAATVNDFLTSYTYGGAVQGLQGLALGYNSAARLDVSGAPSEPGARYAWASNECIAKNAGCAADDVRQNYDPLMEQSCRAALSAQEYEDVFATWKKNEKTLGICSDSVRTCLAADRRCGAQYTRCETDTDLDRYFSECLVEEGGCDDFARTIRPAITLARNEAFAAKRQLLNTIITGYRANREERLAAARNGCRDGGIKDACVVAACSHISPDCMDVPVNKALANRVCAYVDIACGRIR